jgi:T5orf172 domain
LKAKSFTSAEVRLKDSVGLYSLPKKKRKPKGLAFEAYRDILVKQAHRQLVKTGKSYSIPALQQRYKLALEEAQWINDKLLTTDFVSPAELRSKPALRLVETSKQQERRLAEEVAEQDFVQDVVIEKTEVAVHTLNWKSKEQQTVSNTEHLQRIKKTCSEITRITGKQVDLKEGFVYIAVNAVFEGWYKVGMTLDYEARLATYNTSCPFDGFKFIALEHVSDRRQTETQLLTEFAKHSSSSKGEWFKIEEGKATALFASLVNSLE